MVHFAGMLHEVMRRVKLVLSGLGHTAGPAMTLHETLCRREDSEAEGNFHEKATDLGAAWLIAAG